MVAVIGAGLTGLTAALTLRARGVEVTVYERSDVAGGHIRSETVGGIPYEPQGAHIFHTNDPLVWDLVTRLVDMEPYRHRVLTEHAGQLFTWPLQLGEMKTLDEWPTIAAELRRLTDLIDSTNFETWCISQMGETLYRLFIDGYTFKQWGRAGNELAASIGPKRVQLRTDFNPDLFTDRYQGWPVGGYGRLIDAIAAHVPIVLGQQVTIGDIDDIAAPGEPVIVTSALDEFFGHTYGQLEWRGVSLVSHWKPDTKGFEQPAMVVNRPSLKVPYTRTIETKWVMGDSAPEHGTVVMHEYPGADARHYPVPDAAGTNQATQDRYLAELTAWSRNPMIPAGRLARYTYINMDQAMRHGLDAAVKAMP